MHRQFLVLVFSICVSIIIKAEKHAFLITIGEYQDEDISSLSSANDAIHIKEALIYNGFSKEKILHLSDQQATKEKIIHTFYNILIPKLKHGDQLYFQFSGHGQQIFDQNGDEIDGYDESILAYDARPIYSKGTYEGEKHIRDDELEEIFNVIRKSLGQNGQLVVVFDSCHSGTMTRGNKGVTRGIISPFQLQSNKSTSLKKETEFFIECLPDNKSIAPIISIAASSPYELNSETVDFDGNGIGSLSFAIFNGLGRNISSFNELFQEIRFNMMKLNQTPAIEGDLTLSIFGTERDQTSEALQVSAVEGNKITINAGQLQGIHSGSIISFMEARSDNLLFKDTVEETTLTNSIINLTKKILPAELYRSKLSIHKRQYPFKLPLSYDLNHSKFDSLNILIKNNNKFLKSDSAIYLLSESNNKVLNIYRGEELITSIDYISFDSHVQVGLELERIFQLEFIRQINESNNSFRIIAELKLINNQQVGQIFKIGDKVELIIKNEGTEDAYFNLIEIYPNSLEYIFKSQNPQDLFLSSGQYKSYTFTIQEPAEVMSLRVFASKKPLYFNVAKTRGGQDFINTVLHPPTRGLGDQSNSISYGITTLEYEIIE
jgi:hypothetical protein